MWLSRTFLLDTERWHLDIGAFGVHEFAPERNEFPVVDSHAVPLFFASENIILSERVITSKIDWVNLLQFFVAVPDFDAVAKFELWAAVGSGWSPIVLKKEIRTFSPN